MSLFGKILEKLGLNRPAQAEPVPQVPPAPQAAPAAPPAPAPIAVVDVVAQLEKLAASHAEKLNWKVSIVDLLKLLGLESSFAARKELSVELGCPAREDGRLGTDEHVVAQDRAAEARRQRRQHSEGTGRLTDAVVPRVAPAWPSAGPPSAPVLAGAAPCGGSVASQGDGLSSDGLFPLAAVNHGGTTDAAKRRKLSLPHMIAVSEWLVARGFAAIVSQRYNYSYDPNPFAEDHGEAKCFMGLRRTGHAPI